MRPFIHRSLTPHDPSRRRLPASKSLAPLSAIVAFAIATVSAADCPGFACSLAPGGAGDRFGTAVARVNGIFAVIGAPEHSAPIGCGLSFLMDVPACGLIGGYPPPNPGCAIDDRYGWAVAGASIPGGVPYVVIGAPNDDSTGGTDAGIAYARRANSAVPWSPVPLVQPTPVTNDHFGFSVAAYVAGNPRAAVGEPGSKVPFADSGQVHVFDAIAGALLFTLTNPTPGAGDSYGFAMHARDASAAGPARLVVGSPNDDNAGGADAGAVYLQDGAAGALLCPITPPVPAGAAAGWRFGSSVALHGDRILIGAPGAAGGAGLVYVFDACGDPTPLAIPNPFPLAGDGFGSSVSGGTCASTMIIGAPGDDGAVADAGRAYVYDVETGALLDILENPTPFPGDLFGASVAAVGETILVGASSDIAPAVFGGGVYTFKFGGPDCNGNCVPDACDLVMGTSGDCNGNNLPDECEMDACPGDLGCPDGVVDGGDIAAILGAWGPCVGCPEDLNDDGFVDGGDIAVVLGNWGPC